MRYPMLASFLLASGLLLGCHAKEDAKADPSQTHPSTNPTDPKTTGPTSGAGGVDTTSLPKEGPGSPVLGGGDKDRAADALKEESLVPYDSKTRGALQVKTVSAKTGEWFDVLQDGKSVIGNQSRLLNESTVELSPGAYIVTVNRSERKVTIEVGKKTVLWTGEVVVEGANDSAAWYEPYQGKKCMLARIASVVNAPTSLFAGKYTIKLSDGSKPVRDLGEIEVKAGKRTMLKQ